MFTALRFRIHRCLCDQQSGWLTLYRCCRLWQCWQSWRSVSALLALNLSPPAKGFYLPVSDRDYAYEKLGCFRLCTAADFADFSGNLRTSDSAGPYNVTLLTTQYNEIKAGIAARQNYTDLDIVHFLTNVECLEGQFDTWGTFGYGFLDNLTLGGPTPIGARKANLTEMTLPYMQEVALNEQVSGPSLITSLGILV